MDYKDTLLLPKTNFPMRGNIPTKEKARYDNWFKNDIYNQMKKKREGSPIFTMHDGPPYANGDIHIGHALNKILKDIITKYNYFQGKDVRWTPGWDCHGLPIEQEVEKNNKDTKKENFSKTKFRQLCREHANKFITLQKDSFKSLGIVADWDKPYITMDFKFEADIYRTLCNIAQKGLLVERHKPIFWSWAARTALADAEVEYKEKEDYSIYVNFKLDDTTKEKLNISKNAGFIIWTTTPWTLPSNSGISINPDEQYILTSDNFIIANSRYKDLKENNIINGNIERKFLAQDFENLNAINPLNNRKSKIILGEHVLLESGTGCVHTAPGHGEEDYRIGLKYNLDILMPVDERGCFDESIIGLKLIPNPEKFLGMHIFKANEPILELLGDNLIDKSKFKHSYPHCWRTKTPLIYRATNQFFIAMDEKIKNLDKTLRELTLNSIENIKFYPEKSKNRLQPMIEDRPDWCISRQRTWGVPIAFFRVKSTKEIILDERVLNFIAMIFDKFGTDAWYSMPIEQLLYPALGYKAEDLEKIDDILDVWFDSGSTWNTVLKSRNYNAGNYPASLYLEGSDQHRGWFQSSIILSSALNLQSPYKNLLTHGFTVDKNGRKMSKSEGNVISPDKIIKQYGAEILRLWVALSDYQNDLKISDEILKQTAEQYRKIRNTFRFLLANIEDLVEIIPTNNFGEIDKWILNKASSTFNNVKKNFDKYNFLQGFSILNNFITNYLSGIYLDISKDTLYCESKTSLKRASSQSTMLLISKSMLGLIAPILTHTSDEILEFSTKLFRKNMVNIFDLNYETLEAVDLNINDDLLIKARNKFLEEIDRLKKDKIIQSTLEVEIIGDIKIFKLSNKKNLEDWFAVSNFSETTSNVNILTNFNIENKIFKIIKTNFYKCSRCWRYKSSDKNILCARCNNVLNDT